MSTVNPKCDLEPVDLAHLVTVCQLLRTFGSQVRTSKRADCPLCRGKSAGTLAFTGRLWHCHRCQAGGDLFSLVQQVTVAGLRKLFDSSPEWLAFSWSGSTMPKVGVNSQREGENGPDSIGQPSSSTLQSDGCDSVTVAEFIISNARDCERVRGSGNYNTGPPKDSAASVSASGRFFRLLQFSFPLA